MERKRIVFGTAALIILSILGCGLYSALVASPPDADQGNMIRAFYYHFPNWIGVSIFLPLNLVASLAYLYFRSRDQQKSMKADAFAVATAEMGVLYCVLGLVSGSLWGREAWGIWWTWDARLTTTLLLCLVYVSYLLLRGMTSGSTKATLSAVLAVFGFIDIPIVYMSTRWWRTQHPAPVFGGGENSGIAPNMLHPVLWNVAGWVLWGVLIACVRYSSLLNAERNEQAVAMELIAPEQEGFSMSSLAAVTASIFPFDPSIDTHLGHRNLVVIYSIVWVVQFGYAAFSVAKWRSAKIKGKHLGVAD